MIFGYARTLPSDKDCAKQKKHLQNQNILPENLYIDSTLTKSSKCESLKAILAGVTRGDTLIVSNMSCLGTSLHEIILAVVSMDTKKAHLSVLEDGLDTRKHGKILFRIFCSLADSYKELKRTKIVAGVQNRKKKGRTVGRPKKISEEKIASIKKKLAKGYSLTDIADEFKVSRQTISRIRNLLNY